jgi:hypothetical protein
VTTTVKKAAKKTPAKRAAKPAARAQWEYRWILAEMRSAVELAGLDGWELVTSVGNALWFKRRI